MEQKKTRAQKLTLAVSIALIVFLSILLLFLNLKYPHVPASSSLTPVSSMHANDTLAPHSRWVGILSITDHRGQGKLENGMRLIRGTIGQDEKGCFFELYNREDPDSARPLLTLGVRLEGDTMVPEIGEEDAAYFYIWLDERDVEAFTLRLENGTLAQRYFYNDGFESCWIEFHIKQEKNT